MHKINRHIIYYDIIRYYQTKMCTHFFVLPSQILHKYAPRKQDVTTCIFKIQLNKYRYDYMECIFNNKILTSGHNE